MRNAEPRFNAAINENSASGSSTSSSHSRQVKNEFVEKDIDQLIKDDKRTPKILKKIFALVAIFVITIMLISATLLGFYIRDSL